MSVTKFNKEEFLSLVINKLATESGLKEVFYQKMLLGLHDNDPVYKSDTVEHTEGGVTVPSDVFSNILNNIDWEMFMSTEYGEDEFFNGPDGLYTSLGNALKEVFEAQGNDYKKMDLVGGDNSWWSNSYWNESVARLMQILAQRIDPDNIKTYEQSGLLIELVEPPESDGMTDVDHLRGNIAPERGNYEGTLAELRIIDIIDADAGYSFAEENDTYWFGKYFDKITYSYRKDSQSELQSVTYEKILYKQEALETLAAIENGYEISVENLTKLLHTDSETSLGSYIYSGKRVSEHIPPFPSKGTIQVTMETEGEKYTFKVVKNPWVIPWYNIDGETYRRVRGDDKKLSALTDPSKLDFTRLRKDPSSSNRWIRLIMPQYKRRVEVEDLNRNFWVIGQVLAGICIDIFDPNGPIGAMIKGLLNEIAQLWENVTFLWAALALLSQGRFYGETYTEVVTIPNETFLPYLKYDNFDKLTTSTSIEIIKQKLNYLISQYPEKNLMILPQIRLQNYERNYYDVIWYPGVFVYDRNKDIGWEVYYFYPDEEEKGIVVDLKDYVDYIYGLHEEEETYSYLAPLSDTENETADDDVRFYGMARDKISIEGNLYTYDEQSSEWNEDKDISVVISFIDLAKYLVTQDNPLILCIFSFLREEGMLTTTLYDIKDEGEIDKVEMASANIERGYYQGEVLSTYMDVEAIKYEIHVETYSYQNMNPDDNQSKFEIVENPLIYKNKYWANDKVELEVELNRIWEEREYTKKDILFLKAERTYTAGYSLPCGFGIMFYIKGEKQEYYYPLVTDQLGFNGIYWIYERDEEGYEKSYGTNHFDNEFIILRRNEDDKLTSTNWSIMFISCYGGQHVPIFRDVNSPNYLGSVRALNKIYTMPSDVHDWEGDGNAKRWSDVHGTQPSIQQEIDIQNDTDYQNDIKEIYEFLNETEFVNPDGYYVDGGIFMGQTILAFGPGENQWGSQTYSRKDSSEWQPDALTWTKGATLNGSEKGFNDLRSNYVAFMNLNGSGKKYSKGKERNYDRYKDNGRAKMQNGDSLTDWQAYVWEDEI